MQESYLHFWLPERFGLFNFKPGHQPVKLLPYEGSDFLWITWPAKTALCLHPFVKEQKTIAFPQKCFDPVASFPAEQVKGAASGIHMEFVLYDSAEPIDGTPHIRIAADNVNLVGGGDVP